MFQNIHLANIANQSNSGAGQKQRGRTPKQKAGSGGGQWEHGFFSTDMPGVDPGLQSMVAVGTHLSAGYTMKTTGAGSKALGHSQPAKKSAVPRTKSPWGAAPKKAYEGKTHMNSDLFPANPEQKFFIDQYHITQKAIRDRANPKLHKKLNSPDQHSSSQRRHIHHHTFHYDAGAEKNIHIEDMAMIFNSSLKKAKDADREGDGSMFEEPLASSSKEREELMERDVGVEANLGIDFGEDQISPAQADVDVTISSHDGRGSPIQEKYTAKDERREVSKSQATSPAPGVITKEVQVGTSGIHRRLSSEMGQSSLMDRTQYGSQQVFTTNSIVTNNYAGTSERLREDLAPRSSVERRVRGHGPALQSQAASTRHDLGALETGKGSIRCSLDGEVILDQDGEGSPDSNDLARPDSGTAASPRRGLEGAKLHTSHHRGHASGAAARQPSQHQGTAGDLGAGLNITSAIVVTSGGPPSPARAVREAEQQAKTASPSPTTGRGRSPRGRGPALAPNAYNGLAGLESPGYRTAGSAAQMLPYNASAGGLRGRKVPKNSSFMRNAGKPKTAQQASSKPTLSKPAYYMAFVEANSLTGLVAPDHPDLKGLSPTVVKENIRLKSKPGSPATSPTAAQKTGVTVGLRERSPSRDPTVAGAENRSQTPQSLHAPASPTEAAATLQFFSYDKGAPIVSANQPMLVQANPRTAPGPHCLRPQKRQMSHKLTSEAMSGGPDHTDGNTGGAGPANVGSSGGGDCEGDDYGQPRQRRRPKRRSLAEAASNPDNDKANCDLHSPGLSTVNAATSGLDMASNRFSPKHQQTGREARGSSATGGQSPGCMLSNDFGILNYPPPQMEGQKSTIGSGRSSNRNLASHRLVSGQIARPSKTSQNQRHWVRRSRQQFAAGRQATASHKEYQQHLMLSAERSGSTQQASQVRNIAQLVSETRGRQREEPQPMNPIVVKSFSPSGAHFVSGEQLKPSGTGLPGTIVSPSNAFTSQAILRANRGKSPVRSGIGRASESKTQQHLKYEIIEKLLQQDQSDKEQTAKNLEEMTTLYQGLLENNSQASIQIIQHYNALKGASQASLVPVRDDGLDQGKQSSEAGLTRRQKQTMRHSVERWNQSIMSMSNAAPSSQPEIITSKLPQTHMVRTRSPQRDPKKAKVVATKQSFNVPLNQRASKQAVTQILAEHSSIPLDTGETPYRLAEQERNVETQLTAATPEREKTAPSPERERSLSAGKQATVLFSKTNSPDVPASALNVEQQTSFVNSNAQPMPAATGAREQQHSVVGTQANVYGGRGESAASEQRQADKRSERTGSRTGRNYTFQGKLIVGQEEAQGLRDRERFIREQFSSAHSQGSGAGSRSASRQPESNANRAMSGTAQSSGRGINVGGKPIAPSDYASECVTPAPVRDASQNSNKETSRPRLHGLTGLKAESSAQIPLKAQFNDPLITNVAIDAPSKQARFVKHGSMVSPSMAIKVTSGADMLDVSVDGTTRQVTKQEVTVPKAGKLEEIKRSRLRELSSNHVSGFKLRNKSGLGGIDANYCATTQNVYSTSMSNHDLYNILNKPVSQRDKFEQLRKSGENWVNQTKSRDDIGESRGEMDETDEVGTQMLSRHVLTNAMMPSAAEMREVNATKYRPGAGSTMRDLLAKQKETLDERDEQKSVNSLRTDDKNQHRRINSQMIPFSVAQSHLGMDNDSQAKVGTIKVQEFYQQQFGKRQAMDMRQDTDLREASSQASGANNHRRIDLLLGPGSGVSSSRSINAGQHTLFKNFERLSGMITEQSNNKQRTAHVERLRKTAKARFRVERRTNVQAQSSKFHSDLQELRQQQTQHLNDFFEYEDDQQAFDLKFQNVRGQDYEPEQNKTKRVISEDRPKTLVAKMIHKEQLGKCKKVFTISKNAVNSNNKKLIKHLLNELESSHSEGARVPMFKQNCLVQYILEEWKVQINGQLKQFSQFCKFTDNLKVQVKDSFSESECYSLILYGSQTPVSNCCGQLICFQFIKEQSTSKLYCLEPSCKTSLLEVRPINSAIFHTIFLTRNNRLSGQPTAGSQTQMERHQQKTNPLLGNIGSNQVRAMSSMHESEQKLKARRHQINLSMPGSTTGKAAERTRESQVTPDKKDAAPGFSQLKFPAQDSDTKLTQATKPNVIHVSMLLKNRTKPTIAHRHQNRQRMHQSVPHQQWLPINVCHKTMSAKDDTNSLVGPGTPGAALVLMPRRASSKRASTFTDAMPN